jgi:hypothetical protein
VKHAPNASEVTNSAQHSPMMSTFPDMVLRARVRFTGPRFRMRAGNLATSVSPFLRGDSSLLLCYGSQSAQPMAFVPEAVRGPI